MKRFYFLFLLFASTQVFSQSAVPPQLRAQMTLDRISDPNGVGRSDLLYGIPNPPGRLLGDYYLDTKWNNGTIMLLESETMIEGYLIKYDLKAQTLEIKAKNGIKLIDTKKVRSLVWLDSLTNRPRYFINAKDYREDNVPLTGLIEVVADGSMPLFCYATTWIKKSDYIPAFDVGSRDEMINKKKTYYYNNGSELIKITNKKNLFPAFGDKSADVEKYIKVNTLDVKDPSDLARIFEYYNSLTPDKS